MKAKPLIFLGLTKAIIFPAIIGVSFFIEDEGLGRESDQILETTSNEKMGQPQERQSKRENQKQAEKSTLVAMAIQELNGFHREIKTVQTKYLESTNKFFAKGETLISQVKTLQQEINGNGARNDVTKLESTTVEFKKEIDQYHKSNKPAWETLLRLTQEAIDRALTIPSGSVEESQQQQLNMAIQAATTAREEFVTLLSTNKKGLEEKIQLTREKIIRIEKEEKEKEMLALQEANAREDVRKEYERLQREQAMAEALQAKRAYEEARAREEERLQRLQEMEKLRERSRAAEVPRVSKEARASEEERLRQQQAMLAKLKQMSTAEMAQAREEERLRQHQATEEEGKPSEEIVEVTKNAIDQILEKMELGNIAFNAPKSMYLHETAIIHLLLGLAEEIDELKQRIEEEGEKVGARLRVSAQMEARLSGPSFTITEITPILQAVPRNEVTEWKWEVKPMTEGNHNLHLTLSALISAYGTSTPKVIRTFNKIIEVDVTLSRRLGSFFEDNWQWLWAALLVPVGGWLLKRKKGTRGNQDHSDS